VRTLDTPNDFQMMLEVLSRRFKRGLAEGDLPDLIVMDGGKGQLNIAVEVLDTLGVVDVEIASLAKQRLLDEHGHVRRGAAPGGPTSEDPEYRPERVFRPGRKNPVKLRETSNAMYLLQRLRDEAHRFAIEHHKRLRRKRTLASELDAVEGIGPKRRGDLLRHFGSLKRLREATVAELTACPGISEALATRLHAALEA
jgi:excinuclease ABC subunit C